MTILELLKPGRENAIPAKTLAAACGAKTVRDLQKKIEAERGAGAVILSTTQDGGGYYLPSSEQEVRDFIRTLSNRAKNTMKAAESARRALEAAAMDEYAEGWPDYGTE